MNVVGRFLRCRKQSDNIKMMVICTVLIILVVWYMGTKYKAYSEMINTPRTLTVQSYKEILNPYDIENLRNLDKVTGVRLLNEEGEETTIKEEVAVVEVALSSLGRQGKYALKMQDIGWILIDTGVLMQIQEMEQTFYLELKYCLVIIFLLAFITRLYYKLENKNIRE